VVPRATLLLLVLAAAAAGCGSSSPKQPSDGLPRLGFDYDISAPLMCVDNGPIVKTAAPVAIHDVSFASGGREVQAYLLLPRGAKQRPAVVFVPGSGGDRPCAGTKPCTH
jgi:hypothetical protein